MSIESGEGFEQIEEDEEPVKEDGEPEEKRLVADTYREALEKITRCLGISLTATELMYLHHGAEEAVGLDKRYRDDLQTMRKRGLTESDREYHLLDVQRPVLREEAMANWLEAYLGIDQPAGADLGLSPIDSVRLPKGEWEFNSSGTASYDFKFVGNSPAEQSAAHDDARLAQRSHGNAEPLNAYYHRNDYFSDETFRKYILIKIEERRAESGVSDIPDEEEEDEDDEKKIDGKKFDFDAAIARIKEAEAKDRNTLIGEPSTPEEYQEKKEGILKVVLALLTKLGIDPETLSDEETDLLDQQVSQVIKMYAKEPRWTDDGPITNYEYWDHVTNGWLIADCGVSIDELASIQGYQYFDKNLVEGITKNYRISPSTPIKMFDTVEKRKQLAQSPEIVEYRIEQQLMREREAKSMGIVEDEGREDKSGRAREIHKRMQRLGKSEQEIKEELNRLFDRTGD